MTPEEAATLKSLFSKLVDGLTPVVVPPPAPPPVVQPPPVVVPAFAPPDIMDLDLTSVDAVKAYINEGNMSGGTYGDWPSYASKYSGDMDPEFKTDDIYGLHYLQCGIGTGMNNLRAINWQAQFAVEGTKLAIIAPTEELYTRYCVFIGGDVIEGMNPALLGCKLSGPRCNDNFTVMIAEHSLRQPEIPDSVSLNAYSYSEEGQQRVDYFGGDDYQSSARAPVGRWFTIEQHVKMNTPLQRDGIAEMWVDGVQVMSRKDWNWRGGNMWVKFNGMQIQFYHGGQNNSLLKPVHYGLARVAMSTKRIGPAPELPYK